MLQDRGMLWSLVALLLALVVVALIFGWPA